MLPPLSLEPTQIFLCSPDGRHLLPVPSSRNDVFSSNVVDLKEKRLLMKFIQTCTGADEAFLRGTSIRVFVCVCLLSLHRSRLGEVCGLSPRSRSHPKPGELHALC